MSAPGPLSRLSLRLRMGLFFAFIAVAGSAGIIGGAVLAASREQGGIALGAFLSVAVLVGISLWVWRLFDENVATPVERAASALTLRARGVAEGDVEVNLGKHLGRLAPAVREVARVLAEQRERERLKLDQRTADLARERRYLSTVLQSLSEGVLVATPDHRITLVNREAGRLLAGEGQIGLDRDLTHLIHRDAIDHALSELSGVPAEGALPDMDLVLSTRADGRFLLARLTLLRDEGGVAGYTLSFRDLTPRIEGARPGAANRREIEVFSTDTLVEGVARALVPELRFRLRGAGGDAGARMIRGDCVALIRLVGALIERIGEVCHGDISVAIGKGQDVPLTLSWDGAALEEPVIEGWRARSLMAAQGAPTVATALEKMGARATFASGKATLLLPDASGMGAVDLDEARPEFFDFDLIGRGAGALADRRLDQLTAVVFDTETTGLEPSAGDRLVQIAGQRVVHGRLREGDVFDTLVDPGRPIPAASTAIHHITNEMVVDAPDEGNAVRAFHAFAEGAVLVAHNAAFDLAFLSKVEGQSGVRFDQPVLDTVLLSAIAFPHESDHTLDGLAARLGVTIPEPLRHTALGDSVATADVFLRLIPLLEGQGIETLSDAIEASDKMLAIRRQQAKY